MPNRLEELKEYVLAQGWPWQVGKEIPHGEQAIVSDGAVRATINFYPRREHLVVGGPASPLRAALEAWIDGATSETVTPEASAERPTLPASHVGMDEAGKGDWFGPIVVAAVFLPPETAERLQRVGVRDSKRLDAVAVQRLAEEIEQVTPPAHRQVTVLLPQEYNRRYAVNRNLNLLLASLYAETAAHLWDGLQPEFVCDQFAQDPAVLESAFKERGISAPHQLHRAEAASVAVAAASILASAAFTAAMAELGVQGGLGRSLPRGASNVAALEADVRMILEREGVEGLERYAKLNFRPVQALLPRPSTSHDAVESASSVKHRSLDAGLPVTLSQPAWQREYHPQGFWRFRFTDGGILDWHSGTTGRLEVRGNAAAGSYRVLKEHAEGKVISPGQSYSETQQKLARVEAGVNKLIPLQDVTVPSVPGVGWARREVILGTRFDFTDGAVLFFYPSSSKLLIQGTPTPVTEQALRALSSPYWPGLESLTRSLKALFPDWQLAQQGSGAEGLATGTMVDWQPLENAMNWRSFWPAGRVPRAPLHPSQPGQEAMLEDWASVLLQHRGAKALLAHAPTGLGKTVAALVPTLAWIAQAPQRRRVYYLVNRTTQHDNPLRELRDGLAEQFLKETGVPLRVVDLIGRADLCLDPNSPELSDRCRTSRERARFDQLPPGVSSAQEVQQHLGTSRCPYHTLQGLMSGAHVVVCDYWWLFSSVAQEHFVDLAGLHPECIAIVDEAHNLPVRVRAEQDVDESLATFRDRVVSAPEPVGKCLLPLLEQASAAEIETVFTPGQLRRLAGGEDAIRSALATLPAPTVERSASVIQRMLRLLLEPDPEAVIYRSADLSGDDRVVGRRIDATPTLRSGYQPLHAVLVMSGTLAAPADPEEELRYQVPLFGLQPQHTVCRKYVSPFPPRNQQWLYCSDTLGTYQFRTEYTPRYVEHVVRVGQVTPGVTAVFFSSYEFLKQVWVGFTRADEQALIVVEHRTDAEGASPVTGLAPYEARLRKLVEQHGRAYLFAVYQGQLAEGADFPRNLIRSIICVSLPLEFPGPFHDRLQSRYEELLAPVAVEAGEAVEGKAREYALNRVSLSLVLQACGRGIRGVSDRCVMVLLDRRYGPGTGSYDWRRYLQPRPYHVSRPERSVEGFHQQAPLRETGEWDPALIAACRSEGELA